MLARVLTAFAFASAAALAAPSVARADVADEPCEGADLGDACDDGFTVGTCQDVDGTLECVEGGATTAASTASATTTAASTASATASGSGGGGSGGGDGSGGSVGGGETDDGCAVRTTRDKTATHVGAGAVLLLASAITLARRLRKRA